MKKVLILLGLIFSLAAYGQLGTIETMVADGDSATTMAWNMYVYGQVGSNEYVVRPWATFLPRSVFESARTHTQAI